MNRDDGSPAIGMLKNVMTPPDPDDTETCALKPTEQTFACEARELAQTVT